MMITVELNYRERDQLHTTQQDLPGSENACQNCSCVVLPGCMLAHGEAYQSSSFIPSGTQQDLLPIQCAPSCFLTVVNTWANT